MPKPGTVRSAKLVKPLMISGLLLLALMTTWGADTGSLMVGDAVYYSFRPVLTFRTQDEPATVRVLLPRPHDDRSQQLVELLDLPRSCDRDELVDASGLNRLLVIDAEVEPGEELRLGYTAIVRNHPLELSVAAYASTGPWDYDAEELKQHARFLAPGPSTGAGREDLRQVADKLSADQDHPLQVARRLYQAVLDRLRYERRLDFKGAGRAWDEGVGECGDYAALFVALCRLAKIPARAVAGFAYEGSSWELHVWAEFHVRGIGWIPCDPSHGDGPSGPTCFGELPVGRLALTRDFDLEFGLRETRAIAILQEYLFYYQGPERPSVQWHVEGTCFGLQRPSSRPRRAATASDRSGRRP